MIEIETERLTLSKLGSKEVNIIKRLIVLALLLMCTALVEAAEGKIDEILDRISQEHDYPGLVLQSLMTIKFILNKQDTQILLLEAA